MKRRIPPFPALRAFEAAARHESFKEAAEELCLTQSAISHQIRGLEELLGVSLFERSAHGVTLSGEGRGYFEQVHACLDSLADATAELMGETLEGNLVIGATPAFTSRWLLPRLASFAETNPSIVLEIIPNDAPLAFPDDGTDILIQYGSEPAEGYRVEPFLRTTRFPVCSPDWLAREGRPESPQALAERGILRDEYGDSWTEWFEIASGERPAALKGPVLPHCELTLRAAKEGQGVAMAYGALIERELASGDLVKLFEVETPGKVIYSMTYPEAAANRPRVAAFRNWVFDQQARAAA
jgi:LysR family glycine cleavage system transcriptional activator